MEYFASQDPRSHSYIAIGIFDSYRDFRDTGPWELVELTNKIALQIFTEGLFYYVDFWNQQESFLIYVWNATA